MLYAIAHFLRDKLPWIWDLVDILNSWLFGMRFGSKFGKIEAEILERYGKECNMGQIANENGFGVWVPSNNVEAFTQSVDNLLASDIKQMGEKGFDYLCKNYLTETTYNTIMKHFE